MRAIRLVFALAFTSLPGLARAEGSSAPPPLAPVVASPPPAAAPPNGETLQDLGVLSVTFAVFSVTGALPICFFKTEPGSIGGKACEGIAGGLAIGLVATAIPLFVVGVRQHDAWLKWKSAPAVTPSARGATFGWAAKF